MKLYRSIPMIAAIQRWFSRHDVIAATLAGATLGAELAWPRIGGYIWLAFLLAWLSGWIPRIFHAHRRGRLS